MEKCHLALWTAISHSMTLTTAPWFLLPNSSWSTGTESLGHCDICDAKNLSTSKQATLQLLVKPGGDLKCGVCRLHDENANRQHQRCAWHKNGGGGGSTDFLAVGLLTEVIAAPWQQPSFKQPLCAVLDLGPVQGDEAALQLCAVYFPSLVISDSVWTETSLAYLIVCLRLTVSLQEAQTRATVLPRGNVSGKPEGNCFYGSTRWGFVVETSHLLPYGFSYMLSKQSYRCPLELPPFVLHWCHFSAYSVWGKVSKTAGLFYMKNLISVKT